MFDSRQTKEEIIEGGMALHARLVEAYTKIERLTAALKSCPCPGGGWNGMPEGTEATVEACVENNVCGCTLGDALKS